MPIIVFYSVFIVNVKSTIHFCTVPKKCIKNHIFLLYESFTNYKITLSVIKIQYEVNRLAIYLPL